MGSEGGEIFVESYDGSGSDGSGSDGRGYDGSGSDINTDHGHYIKKIGGLRDIGNSLLIVKVRANGYNSEYGTGYNTGNTGHAGYNTGHAGYNTGYNTGHGYTALGQQWVQYNTGGYNTYTGYNTEYYAIPLQAEMDFVCSVQVENHDTCNSIFPQMEMRDLVTCDSVAMDPNEARLAKDSDSSYTLTITTRKPGTYTIQVALLCHCVTMATAALELSFQYWQ